MAGDPFSATEKIKSIAKQYAYHQRLANRDGYYAELEIKLKRADKAQFSQIYSDLLTQKHSGKLEQSLVVIHEISPESSDRKEIVFRGLQQSQKESRIINKTRIADKFVDGLLISLSTERPIKSINANAATKFRFRFRSSISLASLPDWRIDFTIVKFIEKSSGEYSKLQEIKHRFFEFAAKTKVSSFLQNLDVSVPDTRVELEFEWVGPPQRLTHESLRSFVTETLPALTDKTDPEAANKKAYHTMLHTIASKLAPGKDASRFLSRHTLKQLVTRPASFPRGVFASEVCNRDYFVSQKADGIRCLVVFTPNSAIAVLPDSIKVAAKLAPPASDLSFTVCDAEAIDDKYYLFDVLVFRDTAVANDDTASRYSLIDSVIASIPSSQRKQFQRKEMTKLAPGAIAKTIAKKADFESDGLIFTENAPYRSMKVFKWKPAALQTIDFLVMSPPKNLLGVKPYEIKKGYKMYWLFSGIDEKTKRSHSIEEIPGYHSLFNSKEFPNLGKTRLFPIQFTTASNPLAYVYYADESKVKDDLSGRVVELGFDPESESWEFHKIREDKEIEVRKGVSYGNHYVVATQTFDGIMDPISASELENLCEGGGEQPQAYFQTRKSPMYAPSVKFNSFVVAQMLRAVSGKDLVVDLAGGRGAFLWVYNGFQVKSAVFADIDKLAIAELQNRVKTLDDPKHYRFNKRPRKHMKISTAVMDLTQNYRESVAAIKKLDQRLADAVVTTFAIHYLISSETSLVNVYKLVDSLLKPGGVFMFTCFSGARVFELLQPVKQGETWSYSHAKSGKLQFSIKKLYGDSENLAEFGQKISLIHPFSKGEYYEENLVNIEVVVAKFKENGYEVLQNGSFGDWLEKYRRFDADMYYKMSEGDKFYTSLYQYVAVRKK
jgi:hypothetical protein